MGKERGEIGNDKDQLQGSCDCDDAIHVCILLYVI